MKKPISYILILLIFTAIGCDRKKKAFDVFNEGVSLSLSAGAEMEKNHVEKSIALNLQAIDKFRETLKIDSNYPVARSALAHSLYLDKKFADAIAWFQRANKKDGVAAINLLESGLCNINLGQIKAGREEIEHAFKLDTSKEMRTNATDDVFDIGTLAFQYGTGYIQSGETEKGLTYQHFALATLKMAHDFDTTRKDISKEILTYEKELKDKPVADK